MGDAGMSDVLAPSVERAISIRVDNLPLPPQEVSPNARGSWRIRAAATRQFRGDCAILIGQVIRRAPRRPLRTPATIYLDIYTGRATLGGVQVDDQRYRPRDVDNAVAACKALIDGMIDAGVLPSDRSEHMQIGSVTIHHKTKSRDRLPAKIVLRVCEPGVPEHMNADVPGEETI